MKTRFVVCSSIFVIACSLQAVERIWNGADGANWTVCMDREPSLKEAVQSRTIFLSEVDSWRDIIPLLSPKVQTVGVALGPPGCIVGISSAAYAWLQTGLPVAASK